MFEVRDTNGVFRAVQFNTHTLYFEQGTVTQVENGDGTTTTSFVMFAVSDTVSPGHQRETVNNLERMLRTGVKYATNPNQYDNPVWFYEATKKEYKRRALVSGYSISKIDDRVLAANMAKRINQWAVTITHSDVWEEQRAIDRNLRTLNIHGGTRTADNKLVGTVPSRIEEMVVRPTADGYALKTVWVGFHPNTSNRNHFDPNILPSAASANLGIGTYMHRKSNASNWSAEDDSCIRINFDENGSSPMQRRATYTLDQWNSKTTKYPELYYGKFKLLMTWTAKNPNYGGNGTQAEFMVEAESGYRYGLTRHNPIFIQALGHAHWHTTEIAEIDIPRVGNYNGRYRIAINMKRTSGDTNNDFFIGRLRLIPAEYCIVLREPGSGITRGLTAVAWTAPNGAITAAARYYSSKKVWSSIEASASNFAIPEGDWLAVVAADSGTNASLNWNHYLDLEMKVVERFAMYHTRTYA